ncbi:MAG TPA: PAS domain S-box protein [Myxococcaceae bacterium]|nr:PAS domain S-box protein [Myxococcaceae bacterium]
MLDAGNGATKAVAADALKRLRTSLADVEAVEQALRGQVVLYESVLASLVEGIVVQDITGKIVAVNASALRILGLSAEQLTGRSSLDPSWSAVHADGSPFPGEQHPSMVTLRTGEPLLGVLMGVRLPGGGTRWISINTQPLRDGHSGPLQGVVCSFQDITARRTHEAAIRASEARFRGLSTQAPVGIFLAGPGGEVQYVNETWTEITGLEPQAALARGWADALHPDDREGVLAAWARSVRTGEPYCGEFRFRRPDGKVRWVLATARILSDDVGRVSGFVGCINDITERRRLEQEREEFFELALDLLCVTDLDEGFLKVSRSFELTLGWTPEELLGRPFLDLVHPEDVAATGEALRQLVEGQATAGFENRYRCKDGSWRWLAWRSPPPAPGSRVLHAVARDVTAQRHDAERLARLAESDPLTGAANRSRLEQAVLEAIARAERSGQPFGVLFADLNQFKAINDRLGHAAGDQALKEVARRMREHLRSSDVVARVGGDEFAVVLEGVRSRAMAEEVAAKLVRAIVEPMHVLPSAPRVGVSIGVALWPEDGASTPELLQFADRAMYRVKRDAASAADAPASLP